ncbi:hypothetical protein BgiMline_019275 [Biomphalaria glabrata]|nr:hypothetical protein BgiMline_032146 [Biomphalaria glabrata]
MGEDAIVALVISRHAQRHLRYGVTEVTPSETKEVIITPRWANRRPGEASGPRNLVSKDISQSGKNYKVCLRCLSEDLWNLYQSRNWAICAAVKTREKKVVAWYDDDPKFEPYPLLSPGQQDACA